MLSKDLFEFLNLRRLPARLTTAETAATLGFRLHDIAPLISSRLLTPLGKPVPNAPKYFAATDVRALAEDREWLDRATKVITRHWKKKNSPNRSTPIMHSIPQ